ncbi:MAG: ABC transporter permease [Clostridia bacterium]|nr:ABC transporter permease [Clostridia bacterium]
MKKAFAIARLSLLKSKKEKAFLCIMIGAALFITFIMGLGFGNSDEQGSTQKIGVLIGDNDKSAVSSKLIEDLKDEAIYDIQIKNEEEIYSQIRQGKVEVGYIIPEGFEESLSTDHPNHIKVISLSASKAGMAISKAIEKSIGDYLAENAVREIALENADHMGIQDVDVNIIVQDFQQALIDTPVLSVQKLEVKANDTQQQEDYEGFAHAAMGMIIQFTMFTVIFTSGEILEERKNKTWSRLLTTPTSIASILGGKIMGAYLIGALQVAILILAGNYLFGVDYGNDILGVIVVMAMFLLAVTGIGIFMSTIAKSMAQLQVLAPIVIVSSCMLGGCFWPLEIVSPTMQNIAKFTPQAWTMQALKDIVIRGKGLPAVIGSLVIISIFALVFFVFGITRVRYE